MGIRRCARCCDEATLSLTSPLRPGEPAVVSASSTNIGAVDLADLRRAVLELELLDAQQFDRSALEAAHDVTSLAAMLVRANRLTDYQAAALVQGKARGLVVGPYLVLNRCGQGGMGVVFKARHRPTGQVVALKILPPSFARDATLVQRFQREVAAAARLDHPNIVRVVDASQDRGVHFLAMDFIEGRDLRSIVNSGGPLRIDQAIDCTIQAARGLEAAHLKGIVHRDIKPANLMLDASGVVRMLDLGLARLIEASGIFGPTASESLTQSGSYMGTVDYSAPEQADDAKTVDHRADIYSLGCTLYFLATGRPPFEGDSLIKKLMAHQNRPAPSLHSARPDVPAALEVAYQAMMAKHPADRPQSMAAVIWLLESCRSSPADRPKAGKGLITFVDGKPKLAPPTERKRGIDATSPAVLRPADGRPDVYPLETEDGPAEARPSPLPLPLPLSPPRPDAEPERPRPRTSPGLLSMAVLAVLGLILIWAIQHSRARRVPARATGETTPRVEPAPKPRNVAERSPAKSEQPPSPPRPSVAKPTPATTKKSARPAGTAGYQPIFNGKDLTGWSGMLDEYEVRDGVIRSRSPHRTVIFFARSFADFVARVEFRLPPGGDGRLVIRYPGRNNPAHSAMCEIQVLDDDAPQYTGLDPRQCCGSAFGLVAARRGHLRPAGDWNLEEVTVKGSTIHMELNGAPILDNDLSLVREFMENDPHPGKDRRSGYFGVTDEGSPVEYRGIQIRELPP
jgi:serine/threonine protein kinase